MSSSLPSPFDLGDLGVLGAGLLAAGIFAWLLAAVSGRLGWIDPLPGGECARKLQRSPVPVVGGLAVALGGAVALALVAPAGLRSLLPLAPALFVAFAVGFWDDRVPGGLPPLTKLGGQALAGAFLAIPLLGGPASYAPWTLAEEALAGIPWPVLALAIPLIAVLAQNAWNTFDNADGTLTSVSILALVAPAPAVAGALIGFLPFNLSLRSPASTARGPAPRRAVSARRLPHVYLGDAGSHWLAVLIVATPPAWPALFLPLLDLTRVSWARVRAGERPWVGDRRHLAHRLAVRGLGPLEVALSMCIIAAPATVLGALGILGGGASLLPLGLAGTALLYASATRWAADPCPQTPGDG